MKVASRLTWLLPWGGLALACGAGDPPPKPPVARETPADEILRIGSQWTSSRPDQGILSPPAKISMFRSQRKATLSLSPSSASETVVLSEDVELVAGGKVHCQTEFEAPLKARYGRRNGEAAIELSSSDFQVERRCNGAHPDPYLRLSAWRRVLVLRSDQLVVVEPTTDKSVFLPADY